MPGDDPVGRQIVRQAEAIAQIRKDLDQFASEMTDTITEVVARVESIEESSTEPSPAPGVVRSWCWRYLGPQGSEALWRELTDWVAWIRHRYPLARRVPPCWAEHSEIVEELTALWLAWQAAYTERDAPLTAAIDWHDRWLPGFLYRVEHGALAIDCAASHRPRPDSAYAEAVGADQYVPEGRRIEEQP